MTGPLRKLIRSLASRIARESRLEPLGELAVIFTDDRGITRVNARCFGNEEPTDVISQPYASHPGAPPGAGGEVIVNVERALAVGGSGKRGEQELALYLAHGLHHLAGARDRTPAQRRAMLRQEQAWLRAETRAGRLRNLWRAAVPGRRCPPNAQRPPKGASVVGSSAWTYSRGTVRYEKKAGV